MHRTSSLSTRARLVAGATLASAALLLGGCSSEPPVAETVATQLPDLTVEGLQTLECGSGEIIADNFVAPQAPYVAQCWTGSPETPFTQLASIIARRVAESTGGTDLSAQACPADVLNVQEGIACRAVYVGEQGNDTLVRVIVTLADLESVLANVPEESPTSDDVIAALEGAKVEVLVGSEPVPVASASPAP